VRDVEALDPHGQRVEPELALQAVERLDALLAPALGLELLLVEREPRVARISTDPPRRSPRICSRISISEPCARSPWTTSSAGIDSALA
jgi:hypothetical protein